jgi:Glycosyl hydrolase family 3 C-terminal domain/Fibronectin type III-like domain/Glycosyl hydrolase family 3 N terminal domain
LAVGLFQRRAIVTTHQTASAAAQSAPTWQDTARPVAEHVDLLLSEMTLEEKVGQLGSRWIGNDLPPFETAIATEGASSVMNSYSDVDNVPAAADSWLLTDGRAAGLVQTFMPGEEGGQAIAGVLSGRIQPSGRLPVQVPRNPSGQPGTYLQPPLGAENVGTSSLDPTPLYPFGHGCSYTLFDVDDLRISSSDVPTDGEFTASVRVRNIGARAGEEVVQLYLHDAVASVTRPAKQPAFARVPLEPGQAAEVSFRVHADRTAFTGQNMERVVEPGDIEILVGTSAADLPCQGQVRLIGPARVVGHDRRLVTPVDVRPVPDTVRA